MAYAARFAWLKDDGRAEIGVYAAQDAQNVG